MLTLHNIAWIRRPLADLLQEVADQLENCGFHVQWLVKNLPLVNQCHIKYKYQQLQLPERACSKVTETLLYTIESDASQNMV